MENSLGPMATHIMANGLTTKGMARDSSLRNLVTSTREVGRRTCGRVKAPKFTKIKMCTRASGPRTDDTVTEN